MSPLLFWALLLLVWTVLLAYVGRGEAAKTARRAERRADAEIWRNRI